VRRIDYTVRMQSEPSDDPRPQPPEPPDPADCCGGGCTVCIYDRHEAALECYGFALAEWKQRHPEAADD